MPPASSTVPTRSGGLTAQCTGEPMRPRGHTHYNILSTSCYAARYWPGHHPTIVGRSINEGTRSSDEEALPYALAGPHAARVGARHTDSTWLGREPLMQRYVTTAIVGAIVLGVAAQAHGVLFTFDDPAELDRWEVRTGGPSWGAMRPGGSRTVCSRSLLMVGGTSVCAWSADSS